MNVGLFTRVLVGVDGSPQGFVALEQAKRLLAPGGELLAVVVCQERLAVHAGMDAPRLADELHAEAAATAAKARELLADAPSASVELLHGRTIDCLQKRARDMGATVVVVGSHSHSRAAGMVLGSVATELLHEAPQAVLVAREAAEADRFPVRVAVGADGSPAAEEAVAAARELTTRFELEPEVVVAEGGKEPDSVGLVGLGRLTWDPRPPVEALLDHAAGADLLVVGSRGLHGVRALGSVSERVAHRAPCSALVVRARRMPARERTREEVVAA